MKYRYEVGEPDSHGNRLVKAFDGEHLVMSGAFTPQRVTVTPAMVVNYWAHRDIDEGDVAAEELAELVNILSGGGDCESSVHVFSPTIAAGTGPVAAPEPDVPASNLRGLQAKVSEHSRQIGTLRDECRAFRERLSEVEQRYETAICEDCGYRYRKPEDACPSCGRSL